MDRQDNGESKRLRTIERWRAFELEEAKVRLAQLARTAAEKEAARDHVNFELMAAQSMTREQLDGNGLLTLEALRMSSEFTALKVRELTAAQASVNESYAARDAAQAGVVRNFQRLSVVQRLSERRGQQAARSAGRVDQKRLDEQALSRLSADRGSERIAIEED
jgi:hypothetical protein